METKRQLVKWMLFLIIVSLVLSLAYFWNDEFMKFVLMTIAWVKILDWCTLFGKWITNE